MSRRTVRKADILALMRRLGLGDEVGDADRALPDEVDLGRDEGLLLKYGLDVDRAVDRLGGSAW